jgi:gamma-glutamyltranspeptidase
MVATSNRLAVEAALWALGEGGGAVDAAVAADAVLGPPTLLRQLLSATPSL